ncbi:MAG: T9SS type A sorting domain-containing protein, partial [bacterium]
LLKGDTSYMAGAWAGAESLDPAKFDFNDHMTHEQAGTALVQLENIYPNPFNSQLRVEVNFVHQGWAKAEVRDVEGRLIEVLKEGEFPAGRHHFDWNALQTAPGIYFFRLTHSQGSEVRKVVLLK